MRKILILLFVTIALKSSAQLAVKAMLFSPAGKFGAVMNKKFTGELMYMGELGEHWRSRAGIAYVPLTPRLDTFPLTAYITGNGTTVIPGYEVFQKYNLLYFYFGADYCFKDDWQFSPYIGMDILAGSILMNYETYYAGLSESSFTGAQPYAGLRLRIGSEYMISDHIGIFADIEAAGYYVAETGGLTNYDFGLGIHYIFHP